MSYSFFIPIMSNRYTVESVKEIFQSTFGIGEVKRVDFVPIEGNPRFQKSFVHMASINYSESVDAIMTKVFNNQESVRMYPDAVNPKAYWILLANKNPVTETTLNIHQVVENARILQELVFNQSAQIARLQETVYNLTTRIFDEKNEQNVIYAYSNYMKHGKYFDKGFMQDESTMQFLGENMGVGPEI